MKRFLDAYREFRAAKNKSKAYKIVRSALLLLTAAFVFLFAYPQVLFAHEVRCKNFTVYSRQPLDQSIYPVLDKVEAELSASPINDTTLQPKIFLTNSQKLYSFLSLYIGWNPFGKGYPLLPTNNVFTNEANVSRDLVFRKSASGSQRSLSGVIAHEITHLNVRRNSVTSATSSCPCGRRKATRNTSPAARHSITQPASSCGRRAQMTARAISTSGTIFP